VRQRNDNAAQSSSLRKTLALLVLVMTGSPVAKPDQASSALAAEKTAIQQQRISLAAQRASLKRQMGEKRFLATLGNSFEGPIPSINPAVPPCPPLEKSRREDLIATASRKHVLDPDLLRALMRQESGFRPCAVSFKGALGLMQLMPATLEQFHVAEPFDPAQSVEAGAALLRSLLERYHGDLGLTLAAYNAGVSRIEDTNPASYPTETKNYVSEILSELGTLSKSPAKSAQPD
jgi:soluble lytic murein transglycosylase-like protein